MAKQSAGLVLFRRIEPHLEVLLMHPGGPFWAKKDDGAWSIPKGEIAEGEDPLRAAHREFEEETGHAIESDLRSQSLPLTPVKQPGGKVVYAWALEGDFDVASLKSNTFSMEWPPHSGRHEEFPEVDRAGWFSLAEAKRKILKAQEPLLLELEQKPGLRE